MNDGFMRFPRYFVSLLVLLLIGAQGCASPRTNELLADGSQLYIDEMTAVEKEQARQQISLAINDGLNRYRIAAGDSLEVMYHLESTIESEDYMLSVNDEILVEFLHHSEMDRHLIVRPDGKITLPRKGDILAVNLKPMDLSRRINEVYSDTIKNLNTTTTVTKFSSKMQELKKAITNSPLGQAKMVTVNPDGFIHLPLIDEIKASRFTVSELGNEVDKQYQKRFKNLEVSLFLKNVSGNTIFVFGEVRQPGSFKSFRPVTLLQAIAQVGGLKETGTLEKIKVLYWDKQNKPHVRTVNLENVLEKMRLEEDLMLADNSVIFVPKTGIAVANKFIDQYISQLFLFNGSSFGVSHEIQKLKLQ